MCVSRFSAGPFGYQHFIFFRVAKFVTKEGRASRVSSIFILPQIFLCHFISPPNPWLQKVKNKKIKNKMVVHSRAHTMTIQIVDHELH